MEKIVFKDGQVDFMSAKYLVGLQRSADEYMNFANNLPDRRCPPEEARRHLDFLEKCRQSYEMIDWEASRAELARVAYEKVNEAARKIEERLRRDTMTLN